MRVTRTMVTIGLTPNALDRSNPTPNFTRCSYNPGASGKQG